MKKRTLGKTGLEVSLIGFGGIPIQRCNQWDVDEIIENLVAEGVNFIDTARAYTNSEEMLGEALKEWGRENFYLATKTPKITYDDVMADVQRSLSELQTTFIDLYQFHNCSTMEAYEKIMAPTGGYAALVACKEKGLIKHIGITSHSYEVLDHALNEEKFETIQFPYNIVENRGAPLFEKAKAKNVGVIVMKPLAGGAFIHSNYALRWVAENPNISTLIPGMDSVKQVLANTSVGKNFTPLDDEERHILEADANALGKTFCRRCGYCAPCPQGIDIPMQFIVEGYYRRYNLEEWALDRYNSFASNASDCIECGECEPKCPYDLPIRDMLKKTRELFDPLILHKK
ncbi:aldo/keto reductase [Acetobacterium bakii]|uniref:Aldo/keto reductase n=1 Tax=Acetobacterium bakii TaxID=52689 RepID=A0A0L6U347_9FIRM|nr:aldo/keto reductase [Acetobacterium bakii]KNZ42929.1 aldo/keto reductase [Acetobacterium bakii]